MPPACCALVFGVDPTLIGAAETVATPAPGALVGPAVLRFGPSRLLPW